MSSDEAREKLEELAATIVGACTTIGLPIDEPGAMAVLNALAMITPPEYQSSMELVTIHTGGREGGESIKPGNILLNMRHLVTAIAGGVLTVVGVVQLPWTAVFGAIVLWDSLYSGVKQPVTERDASVLWTLWILRDSAKTTPHAGLLDAVNDERVKYGRAAITSVELDDALARLIRLKSIKRYAKDPSRWWLCEWVRVSYE